jgi:hypothetical protein
MCGKPALIMWLSPPFVVIDAQIRLEEICWYSRNQCNIALSSHGIVRDADWMSTGSDNPSYGYRKHSCDTKQPDTVLTRNMPLGTLTFSGPATDMYTRVPNVCTYLVSSCLSRQHFNVVFNQIYTIWIEWICDSAHNISTVKSCAILYDWIFILRNYLFTKTQLSKFAKILVFLFHTYWN